MNTDIIDISSHVPFIVTVCPVLKPAKTLLSSFENAQWIVFHPYFDDSLGIASSDIGSLVDCKSSALTVDDSVMPSSFVAI